MRAIDADAFMDTINRNCYPVQHDMTSIEPGMTRMGILQAIQEQPTIEPQRKRGRWKRTVLGSTSGYGTTVMYQCSECEQMSISKYRYCPNCGARMNGGDEGGET